MEHQDVVESMEDNLSRTLGGRVKMTIDELVGLVVVAPSGAPAVIKRFADAVNKQRMNLLPMFHEELDKVVVPAMGGQLVIVNGQSSNNKTGFTRRWFRASEKFLIDTEQFDSYNVVVDWENDLETIIAANFFRENPHAVKDAINSGILLSPDLLASSMTMVQGQTIYIAAPAGRPEVLASLSIENISGIIHYIQNKMFGKKIRINALFLDYLQIIAANQNVPEKQLNQRLTADTIAIRNLGSLFSCPVILATQATYAPYLKSPITYYVPGNYDIAHTRAPHALCDKQFAVHMPIRVHENGSKIEHIFLGGKEFNYTVTPSLFFVALQKQRARIPGTHSIGQHRWNFGIDWATDDLIPVAEMYRREDKATTARYIDRHGHPPANVPSQWTEGGIPL